MHQRHRAITSSTRSGIRLMRPWHFTSVFSLQLHCYRRRRRRWYTLYIYISKDNIYVRVFLSQCNIIYTVPGVRVLRLAAHNLYNPPSPSVCHLPRHPIKNRFGADRDAVLTRSTIYAFITSKSSGNVEIAVVNDSRLALIELGTNEKNIKKYTSRAVSLQQLLFG